MGGAAAVAAAANRAARGSDLRYNLRVTLEEAYTRACRKTINVPTSVSNARAVTAAARKAAAEPINLPDLFRHGQGSRAAGLFHGRTHLPDLWRCWARSSRTPARPAAASGRVEKDRSLSVNIPAGVETGTRIRLAG